MEFQHKPVLFDETIDSLQIRPDGVYIDGTAGGGGHSQAILDKLTTGRLLSIDQDPDAIQACTERFSGNPHSVLARANFSEMETVAGQLGFVPVSSWISEFLLTTWIRRNADFPIITTHRSICG